MPEQTNPGDPRRQRLDEVVGAFLVALDAGQNPSPRECLARHPELQPELAEFFVDRERVDVLIEPLRADRTDQTAAPTVSGTAGQTDTSRSSPQRTLTTMELGLGGATGDKDDGSSEPLPAGTRVRFFGDYELQTVLGEGGMGIVYKARQISLNRAVALKMIKATRFASEDEVRRFHNEAEAVARLDHPNIVPIFEVGQFEDQHYFSMKLIGGESLDKRLKEYIADPRAAARLVAVAAAAIHHSHQRGILHRDLKPANVLVDAEGQPHITDFGLAKRVSGDRELTQTGAILGTPAYMAPEQASASKGVVTTSTDVYGLGAILYALLTGRAPFGGATALETLDQVRERVPDPPRKLNLRVPRDLEIICVKCLAKDPRRRYASADGLADDLKHWLAGEPITARAVGNTARVWMWCRRRPVIAGLLAAVLVAVLGGLIGTSLGLLAALEAQAKEREQTELAKERLHDALKAQAKEKEQTELAKKQTELARQRLRETLQAKVEEKKQTELAEQRLYDVRMNLVQRYWEDYHGELFRQGLDEQLPANHAGIDRRGFEWFYWQRKIASGHITLKAHTSVVTSVAFSPNGKWIASASDDQTVKVWDAANGREIRSLKGHTSAVSSVAFSPDGKRLASASRDQTVMVWDAETGQEPLTLRGHTGSSARVAFSPDGKRLASASRDRTVKVWDTATGLETLTLEGHTKRVDSVAFSPDGKQLASGGEDRTVRLWDVATGLEARTLKGHTGVVTCLAFSPDGTRLASAGQDGMVMVWDPATGKETLTLKSFRLEGSTSISAPEAMIKERRTSIEEAYARYTANMFFSVAFSPDGKRLASAGGDGTVKVWDAATGQETRTLYGHAGFVYSVAFSRDGKQLASAGQDGMVNVWDVGTGDMIRTHKGHTQGVNCVAYSPDGRRLASASWDGTVRVWDAATGQETLVLKGSGAGVAFSPDGQQLASGEKLWDARPLVDAPAIPGPTPR